jgi:hypothetical protein
MTTEKFPAIGHIYEAGFGELAFRLQFDADGAKRTRPTSAARRRSLTGRSPFGRASSW